MAPRTWNDMSNGERTGVLALGTAEIVLTAVAAVDLARRPGGEIRGPKALWWLGILVQPLGPVAYLGWGRRRR